MLTEADITRIGEGEAAIVDGWLGEAEVAAARAAAEALYAAGRLAPARVGRGADRQLRPEIRGDAFLWVEPQDEAALSGILAAFEALRLEVNALAWAGLRGFEAQVARYGAGAGYARHLDAFRGDPNRRLTSICYLNPGWEPAQGGLLRIWPPSGEALVEPLAGRLVVFRADLLEHEVLPAHAPRYAVTAWYR